MRVAYLVAFCQFGYSCITSEPYEQLRQQIQNPDEVVIDDRIVCVDRQADRRVRAIAVPSSPELLRDALLIVCGWYTVILPRPTAPDDFWSRLAGDIEVSPQFAWHASRHAWPDRLHGALDTR